MGIIEAISHEFRTPVTSIMGFARLIQEKTGGDSDTVDYADMIVQEYQQACMKRLGVHSELLQHDFPEPDGSAA